MYNIRPYEYIINTPWMKPLQYRVNSLIEAKKSGLKVAMYLYEAPDTSTFRYRVYNVCQALEISLEWRGVYFYQEELKIIEKYLESVDLIVIARYRWNFELDRFVKIAKSRQIPIAFDVDDMVYNPDYVPIIVNTLSVNMNNNMDYDYWFAYTSRLNAAAKLCDVFITTNGYLADKLGNDLGKKTYIVQNFLNIAQEEASYNYYAQKQRMYSDPLFTIGYFSGTPSHINDFLTVSTEISDFLYKYGDTRLCIVGYMELPACFDHLVQNGRVIRKELVDFIELQRLIAEVDVNIAPLVNNDFSNCKSELKYFEASVVGTLTCATPSWIYQKVIDDGVNGFLCDKGKWYETLEKLYLNRELCSGEIVENAWKACLDRYAYANQTGHIENVFETIVKER